MLIPFDRINEKYKFNVTGVLHVGAHEGEEADDYDRLGFNPVYWVEADANTYKKLERNVGKRPGHYTLNAACSDKAGLVTFHHANNGQSSSLLELGTHATEHPDVVYVGENEMLAVTVDQLVFLGQIGDECNFVNLDVQGAELMVLKGATEFLQHVDYIYTEVNKKELYVGCVQLPELDRWLRMRGFSRVETEMTPHGWGDALYIKV
jgi:FkbM family methyltransferase